MHSIINNLFFFAVCPSDPEYSAGTFQLEVYGYLAASFATLVNTFGNALSWAHDVSRALAYTKKIENQKEVSRRSCATLKRSHPEHTARLLVRSFFFI